MYTKYVSVSLAVLFGVATAISAASPKQAVQPTTGYIIEAANTESAVRAVRTAGGQVTHELQIINGVSALLTSQQVAKLRHDSHHDTVCGCAGVLAGD